MLPCGVGNNSHLSKRRSLFIGGDDGTHKIFWPELFWIVKSHCYLSFNDEEHKVRRLSYSAYWLVRFIGLDVDVISNVDLFFQAEFFFLGIVQGVGSQSSYYVDRVFFGSF